MADTPLSKKLLIKTGYRVLILNAPEGYTDKLNLPENVTLSDKPDGAYDVVHLFAKNKAELEKFAIDAIKALKSKGILWMSYPKGSSKLQSDLTRDNGWEIVTEAGYQNVTQVSVDDTWAASRMMPIKAE